MTDTQSNTPAEDLREETAAEAPEVAEHDRTAELESQLAEAKQQTLYAQAEIQNVRRRAEKDVADARAYAATNFARDVAEDRNRKRLYVPLALLREAGGDPGHPFDPKNAAALAQAAQALARHARDCYDRAEREVDAYAADCRPAVQSCIGVYRALNNRILAPDWTLETRASAPLRDKWRALPASKYWRILLSRFPGW